MLKAPDGTETMLKLYRTAIATNPTASNLPPLGEAPSEVAAQSTSPNEGSQVGALIREKKHLYVTCLDGLLQIEELQIAGKKRMDAVAFLNGMPEIEKYSLI